MATNEVDVAVPPATVFELLADGERHAEWVVGAKRIRAVDGSWPTPGSRLHHTVGVGPLEVKDSTSVIDVDPPRRLLLEARFRPVGRACIDLQVGHHPEGSLVRIDEQLLKARQWVKRLVHPLIRVRNARALRRLRELLEDEHPSRRRSHLHPRSPPALAVAPPTAGVATEQQDEQPAQEGHGGVVPGGSVPHSAACRGENGPMTSWGDFAEEEPEFAERVERLLRSAKHLTLATLRTDGSPRISGTEIVLDDEDVVLGMGPSSVKALDLRRDPRLALHGPTAEPPEGAPPDTWSGEAKLAGRAEEIVSDEDDGALRFRIDLTEIVLTRVGTPPDHLVVESWHPDRGYQERKRY